MTPGLFLSRARLRSSRGEALSAIAPLLIPDNPAHRAGHAHRVLWLLFQDVLDAKRDFLWRDEGDGRYLILSPREPTDPHSLFELDSKPFEPALSIGDRLAFTLRANPVVARKGALNETDRQQRKRGKRVDVVMDALKPVPVHERARVRDKLAQEAGAAWLAHQGQSAGFDLQGLPSIDGYAQVAVERRRGQSAGFSVLNMSGVLEVKDPVAFLARLPMGFGAAKAFGNGLMLIRRA